jgi:hypothetical protein
LPYVSERNPEKNFVNPEKSQDTRYKLQAITNNQIPIIKAEYRKSCIQPPKSPKIGGFFSLGEHPQALGRKCPAPLFRHSPNKEPSCIARREEDFHTL